jgi:hypothetical protein
MTNVQKPFIKEFFMVLKAKLNASQWGGYNARL